MRQFFKEHAPPADTKLVVPVPAVETSGEDVVCDEELLASFGSDA
jgi:hypothetical protein